MKGGSCKVITPQEQVRIEKRACAAGSSQREYMSQAGQGIAAAVEEYLICHGTSKQVTLLIGKGNNGGDACAAGIALLKKGITLVGFSLYPAEEWSPLLKEEAAKFQASGGTLIPLPDTLDLFRIPKEGIILDGIVGTGFRGGAEGIMREVILAANGSPLPILSIDIPSGLNGSTGEVATVAIEAAQTLYLEFPKLGFFLDEGWNHVGDLKQIEFGLSESTQQEAIPSAFLMGPCDATSYLPPIKRTRHKYNRGYLIAVAGSDTMPGAAFLTTLAALRSGAGIVRLFHQSFHLPLAPEVMAQPAKEMEILIEAERAQALLLGPGIGRAKEAKKLVKFLLKHSPLPCVVDGDALYFLSEHPSWKIRGEAILTPHRGEMERLLGGKKPNLENCQAHVEKHRVTLLLKGAPNFLFHPDKPPLIIARGDPGMATAGAGDVLTGLIAALLAQGLPPYEAAALGAYLHGLAGERAALENTSHCVIASDLITHLSDAFAALHETPWEIQVD